MGLLPDQEKIYSSETFSSENLYMKKIPFLLNWEISCLVFIFLSLLFCIYWLFLVLTGYNNTSKFVCFLLNFNIL